MRLSIMASQTEPTSPKNAVYNGSICANAGAASRYAQPSLIRAFTATYHVGATSQSILLKAKPPTGQSEMCKKFITKG